MNTTNNNLAENIETINRGHVCFNAFKFVAQAIFKHQKVRHLSLNNILIKQGNGYATNGHILNMIQGIWNMPEGMYRVVSNTKGKIQIAHVGEVTEYGVDDIENFVARVTKRSCHPEESNTIKLFYSDSDSESQNIALAQLIRWIPENEAINPIYFNCALYQPKNAQIEANVFRNVKEKYTPPIMFTYYIDKDIEYKSFVMPIKV